MRSIVLSLIATITLSAAQFGSAPGFEVVSIRARSAGDPTAFRVSFEPGRFVTVNAPLSFWFHRVYPTPNLRVEGQPSWFGNQGFDINARAEGVPPGEQMLGMVRLLLRDRFKLVAHYESRNEDTFALVRQNPDRLGPQLRVAPVDCAARRRRKQRDSR